MKPEQLTAFLKKIAPYRSKLKGIFIDYAAIDLKPADSIELIQAMKPFGKKLLLPYSFKITNNKIHKDFLLVADSIKALSYPMGSGTVLKDCELGYAITLKSSILEDYRLYKYRSDDEQHYSIPYKLCEFTMPKNTIEKRIQAFDNQIVKLNFLMREIGHYQLFHFVDTSMLTIPDAKIPELVEDKILFLGLF